MGSPVAVVGIDGDEGSHILIVMHRAPMKSYASKNQKHFGFIVEDRLVPDKDAVVSEQEANVIARTFAVMYPALITLIYCR